MTRKTNKVVRVALSGGLIGFLTTNPRAALEKRINAENEQGWNVIEVLDHTTASLFARILQLAVLIATLGLWSFGAGYLVILEKEI